MITREADYAIRVVMCLAGHAGKDAVSTTAVAKEMELPYRFLRKIVRRLSAAGLVGATRGKEGGIFLRQPPEGITMYQVLELFDPKSLRLNHCCQESIVCSRQTECGVHRRLQALQDQVNNQFRQTNFADLIRPELK